MKAPIAPAAAKWWLVIRANTVTWLLQVAIEDLKLVNKPPGVLLHEQQVKVAISIDCGTQMWCCATFSECQEHAFPSTASKMGATSCPALPAVSWSCQWPCLLSDLTRFALCLCRVRTAGHRASGCDC